MPRYTFVNSNLICIDCDHAMCGPANKKRCDVCATIWRKRYRAERNKMRNKHPRMRHVAIKPIQTNVTEKQIIAYLRAYAPRSYADIIRKIEALQAPREILEKELHIC